MREILFSSEVLKMGRKNTEAEAILARQRELNRKRAWRAENRARIRALRTGANQCNSIWTSELHAELVTLFEEKLSTAEIGRRMGLTKNTIIGRLNRCGMRRRGEYMGPTSMERLDMLRDEMDAVIWATLKENWSRMN